MLYFLLIAETKYLTKKEGFILTHSPRIQFIRTGKTGEGAGAYMTSALRKQRGKSAGAQLSFSLGSPRDGAAHI